MENYQILSRIIYQLMVIVIINEYRWLSWSSLGILRHQMKKMFETCATQTSKESFDPNARFTMSPRAKPLEAPTEAPTEAPMDPGIKVGWWQKRTSFLETQLPLQLTVAGAISILEFVIPNPNLLNWDQYFQKFPSNGSSSFVVGYSNIFQHWLPMYAQKPGPACHLSRNRCPRCSQRRCGFGGRFREQGLVSSRPNMP